MHTNCRTLLAACAVLLTAGLVWAGEQTDARALVDKAILATGGAEKLAKHNSTTWKEKGIYHGMGTPLPYTGIYAVRWPAQFRMEIEGVFTIVLNGDKGWLRSMGETKDMTAEQHAQQLYDHQAGWITSLLPLKDKAFHLKTVSDAKVGEQLAAVLQVTRKGYPDVKLFFAKDSHLLVKMEYRTKAAEQKFKEVTQDVVYSDFRVVDGAKVPHKFIVKRDGQVFVEADIIEIRAGKVDDKLFARPVKD